MGLSWPEPEGADSPAASGWWYDAPRDVFCLGQYPILRQAWSGTIIRDIVDGHVGEVPGKLRAFARRLLQLPWKHRICSQCAYPMKPNGDRVWECLSPDCSVYQETDDDLG